MAASHGGGCCPPMDLMRSEPMQLVQVIVPMESAHLTVSYLGDLGLGQLKDLNYEKSPFQRTYAAQMWRDGAKDTFLQRPNVKGRSFSQSDPREEIDIDLDDVEVKLEELESELVEINANNDKLQRSYNELVLYKLVLDKVGKFWFFIKRQMAGVLAGECLFSESGVSSHSRNSSNPSFAE